MRSGYEPPTPRLSGETPWEWVDDPEHGRVARVWSHAYDKWSLQAAWTGLVHEALDRGEPFDKIVATVAAQDERKRSLEHIRRKVGIYLYSLWDNGTVQMDFPRAPRWFTDDIETRSELGRGGVGVAWRCHHHVLGEDVVVKHAWDYFHPLDTMDRLIRKEVEHFIRFDHAGILRLHETFERDGLFHLVREFVDGKEIHIGTPHDLETLLAHARDLVGILMHIHDRGRLLLDLRPTNFFTREDDGAVVLVDVGNCALFDGQTIHLRKTLGSPAFSAPEIYKRKEASAASDVYGLGRLLFTLATGRPPIATWTVREMAGPLGDHPLADLILRLSAEDVEERPSLADVRRRLA